MIEDNYEERVEIAERLQDLFWECVERSGKIVICAGCKDVFVVGQSESDLLCGRCIDKR